ncbi:MAG: helix-turn-helix domain-containing protein [Chloroflexi bacterium]|nr:helix-turn-helix domain-containing protein [Chloroflexota bacterium]
MEKLLLSEHAVGEVLSLGRSSVRKLMDTGRLPGMHIGRSLRFHVRDVERLAEELRQESPQQSGQPQEPTGC